MTDETENTNGVLENRHVEGEGRKSHNKVHIQDAFNVAFKKLKSIRVYINMYKHCNSL